MNFEDLKREILALPAEQQVLLMKEVGPTLCEAIMSQPNAMQEMMPMCQDMMAKHPEMMAHMREMMIGALKK